MNADPTHFDMTPQEEDALNERNARKLYRSMEAWKEVCHLAQVDTPEGFYAQVSPYKVLDIFNRMLLDHLRIDGKA